MKKLLTFALALGFVTMLALTGVAKADNLDFDVLGPAGSISWAGGANDVLIGAGIPVDFVVGLNTLANQGVKLTVTGGVLAFNTGKLTGTTSTEWDFGGGAGSFITITGGIPALAIPDGTTLLSGSFGTAQVFAIGSSFKIAGGLFTDVKNNTLASYFGMGGFPAWSGDFNIAFQGTGTPPGAFASNPNGITSGDVGNTVPEPATMLLLGSGLFGIGVYVRRRFKK